MIWSLIFRTDKEGECVIRPALILRGWQDVKNKNKQQQQQQNPTCCSQLGKQQAGNIAAHLDAELFSGDSVTTSLDLRLGQHLFGNILALNECKEANGRTYFTVQLAWHSTILSSTSCPASAFA